MSIWELKLTYGVFRDVSYSSKSVLSKLATYNHEQYVQHIVGGLVVKELGKCLLIGIKKYIVKHNAYYRIQRNSVNVPATVFY